MSVLITNSILVMILYVTLFGYTVYSEQLITVYSVTSGMTSQAHRAWARAKRGGRRSVIDLVMCIVSIFSKKKLHFNSSHFASFYSYL